MSDIRAYNSPLREEKAREAILTVLFDLMNSAGTADDISMEAIAQMAGVQRRTVCRGGRCFVISQLRMNCWQPSGLG